MNEKSLADVGGASYLILTAFFPKDDPGAGPPSLLTEGRDEDLFNISIKLQRHELPVDKANDMSAAAMKNDVDMMEHLVISEYCEHDLKALNSTGDTALHVALKCDADDAAVYLMKKSPELKHVKNRMNKVPLECASKRMKRLAQYRMIDPEDASLLTEPHSIGYDLRNDSDFIKGSTSLNIYARSLSNALYCLAISTPLTVGIYAPWGSGKSYLLKCVTDFLSDMQKRYNTTKTSLWRDFHLLLMIIFYLPPKAPPYFETDEMGFIFVKFNAWEYAGSDTLWAGIVTKLVSRVEGYAGYWKTRFFRIMTTPTEHQRVQFRRDKTSRGKSDEYEIRKTTLFKMFSISVLTLFICSVVVIITVIIIAVLLLTGVIPMKSGKGNTSLAFVAVEGTFATILGVAMVTNIKGIWSVLIIFLYSQRSKIETMMSKPDFSTKLGFMGDIKCEVSTASSLINWIAGFKKKPIRVIITVDELDRCPPKKIVDVVDAINILMSDKRSPFICILAIDPRIVVQAIDQNLGAVAKSSYWTGSQYIKKLIQIPFSIPLMTSSKTNKFLESLIEDAYYLDKYEKEPRALDEEKVTEEPGPSARKPSSSVHPSSLSWSHDEKDGEERELLEVKVFGRDMIHQDQYMNDLLREFEDGDLVKYISPNPRNIRRIFNLLCLTAHMVRVLGGPLFLPREVVLWTIMLDEWPYRSVHIINHVENNLQKQSSGIEVDRVVHKTMKLKSIYPLVKAALRKPTDWEMLIALDGDPELFERYLNLELKSFGVNDMQRIIPYTLNIDLSIMFSIRQAHIREVLCTK
ncbi:NTPase KAP family P-loop domain-containing protein 1-like [Glandiceps talaboti]